MRTILTIASVALLSTSAWSQLDPETHVKDMQDLAAKIRKLLPKDWKLEMTPFRDGSVASADWWARQDPHIVIYSDKPVRARHKRWPSQPPILEPSQFLLRYRIMPKMSDEDWAKADTTNKKHLKLRDSYRKKLDHLRNKKLKRAENDPENYKPTTDSERRILQEYRFVWPNTRPVELPSFKFKSLSITAIDPKEYDIQPESMEEKYINVAASVAKIFTPYEVPLDGS